MDVQINLTEVFRQTDQDFITLLNTVRVGKCPSWVLERLRECYKRNLDCGDGIKPTRLYPHKKSVERENHERLQELTTASHTYQSQIYGAKEYKQPLARNCPAVEKLVLKIGSQVALVRNVDSKNGLVNGARGVVVDFKPATSHDHPTEAASECSRGQLYPVVKFSCGVTTTVVEDSWDIHADGKVVATYSQIPLALAWALTIHKCQGMTLDKAEICLSNCFEYGQVYVALSRMKSLEGLRLQSFDSRCVKAHSRVLQYYRSLSMDTIPPPFCLGSPDAEISALQVQTSTSSSSRSLYSCRTSSPTKTRKPHNTIVPAHSVGVLLDPHQSGPHTQSHNNQPSSICTTSNLHSPNTYSKSKDEVSHCAFGHSISSTSTVVPGADRMCLLASEDIFPDAADQTVHRLPLYKIHPYWGAGVAYENTRKRPHKETVQITETPSGFPAPTANSVPQV